MVSFDIPYPSVCLIHRAVVCPVTSILMDLKRVTDFQFVWVCSYCKEGSDGVQALCMSDWELDVLFTHILPSYWIFIALSFTCDVSRANKT